MLIKLLPHFTNLDRTFAGGIVQTVAGLHELIHSVQASPPRSLPKASVGLSP